MKKVVIDKRTGEVIFFPENAVAPPGGSISVQSIDLTTGNIISQEVGVSDNVRKKLKLGDKL